MAIVDDNDFIIIDVEGENLTQVNRIKRPRKDRELWYYSGKVFEDKNHWYLKTSTDQNMNVWIEKINKNTFSVDRIKSPAIDINVMAFNGTSLATSSNRIQALNFNFFTTELVQEAQKTLHYRNEETEMIQEIQLSPTEDGFDLLIGFKPLETAYGYNENHLLHLNQNFDVQKDIDLGIYDGSVSAFQFLHGKLYVSLMNQGIGEDGRGLPSSSILVYSDTDDYQSYTQIPLNITSGGRLLFDEVSGFLILDRTLLAEDPQTPLVLIHPETLEAIELSLPEGTEIPNEGHAPYMDIKNGKVYLLLKDQLLIWDISDLSCQKYSLQGITEDGLGLLLP